MLNPIMWSEGFFSPFTVLTTFKVSTYEFGVVMLEDYTGEPIPSPDDPLTLITPPLNIYTKVKGFIATDGFIGMYDHLEGSIVVPGGVFEDSVRGTRFANPLTPLPEPTEQVPEPEPVPEFVFGTPKRIVEPAPEPEPGQEPEEDVVRAQWRSTNKIGKWAENSTQHGLDDLFLKFLTEVKDAGWKHAPGSWSGLSRLWVQSLYSAKKRLPENAYGLGALDPLNQGVIRHYDGTAVRWFFVEVGSGRSLRAVELGVPDKHIHAYNVYLETLKEHASASYVHENPPPALMYSALESYLFSVMEVVYPQEYVPVPGEEPDPTQAVFSVAVDGSTSDQILGEGDGFITWAWGWHWTYQNVAQFKYPPDGNQTTEDPNFPRAVRSVVALNTEDQYSRLFPTRGSLSAPEVPVPRFPQQRQKLEFSVTGGTLQVKIITTPLRPPDLVMEAHDGYVNNHNYVVWGVDLSGDEPVRKRVHIPFNLSEYNQEIALYNDLLVQWNPAATEEDMLEPASNVDNMGGWTNYIYGVVRPVYYYNAVHVLDSTWVGNGNDYKEYSITYVSIYDCDCSCTLRGEQIMTTMGSDEEYVREEDSTIWVFSIPYVSGVLNKDFEFRKSVSQALMDHGMYVLSEDNTADPAPLYTDFDGNIQQSALGCSVICHLPGTDGTVYYCQGVLGMSEPAPKQSSDNWGLLYFTYEDYEENYGPIRILFATPGYPDGAKRHYFLGPI